MKVEYTTRNGRMKVVIEGKSHADIIEQLASFCEVFEDLECRRNGKKSDNVRFVVREVDGNKFYELKCFDVDKDLYGAKLAFGVHRTGGTLFPKRQDKDGNWLPNNGWVKFNKETGKEE